MVRCAFYRRGLDPTELKLFGHQCQPITIHFAKKRRVTPSPFTAPPPLKADCERVQTRSCCTSGAAGVGPACAPARTCASRLRPGARARQNASGESSAGPPMEGNCGHCAPTLAIAKWRIPRRDTAFADVKSEDVTPPLVTPPLDAPPNPAVSRTLSTLSKLASLPTRA